MARRNDLSDFVDRALTAGRSRDEVARALRDAGWSREEVADALGGFADTGFTPPVPVPQPLVSPRDFVVYVLTFVSLSVFATNLVAVAHNLIDRWAGVGASDSTLAWAMSSLLVFGPLYGILAWMNRRALRRDASRHRSALRNWTAALVVVVTVLVLLGNLATVIYNVIRGEAGWVFLAKAAVVAVVAGGVLLIWRRQAQ